jgi:O-antigen ligase
MTAMLAQHQHRYQFYAPASPRVVVITHRKYIPTTRIEHLLLLLNIVLLPMETVLPNPGGYSSVFFLFAISSIYIMFKRFGSIIHIWNHPVFLASYVFILLGLIFEGCSPFASYKEINRIAQMFIGAIVIATLCRDTRALRVCIFGYVLIATLLALYLFLSSYGALQGATATNFDEASRMRAEVFQEDTLGGQMNVNNLAFFLAQGAAVALAIALMSRSALAHYSLFGVTALCFIASFLPLSRSGTAITLLACMAVVLAYIATSRRATFRRFMRIIVLMLGLGACLLLWVPQAVFSRFTIPATSSDGATDARTKVYQAAWVHLPEYWLMGVGAGNFWEGPWGKHSEYVARRGVQGAHNCFIQVAIYWGLPGLLSLLSVVYFAYKCLPKECGNDPLSLAVLGVAVALFGVMFVMHSLEFKGFSLGLGILVGVHHWIWPAGKTQFLGSMIRKTLAERGIAS